MEVKDLGFSSSRNPDISSDLLSELDAIVDEAIGLTSEPWEFKVIRLPIIGVLLVPVFWRIPDFCER